MPKIIMCAICQQNKLHFSNGMCSSCYYRQYHQAHRDKAHEYAKRYYATHKKESAAHCREWGQLHNEERKQYLRQWQKEHPDYPAQWRESNRENLRKQARENDRRRRARKRNLTTELVNEELVYGRDGNMCMYCGKSTDLTIDHIVPISKDGAHCEENLVIACGHCNYSKQDMRLEQWLESHPQTLPWIL